MGLVLFFGGALLGAICFILSWAFEDKHKMPALKPISLFLGIGLAVIGGLRREGII